MILASSLVLMLGSTLFDQGRTQHSVSVTDFGADRTGSKLATTAIQSAIDAMERAGGGTVTFPPGLYVSGTVHLRSGVTLQLDREATLKGSSDLADYVRGNWPTLVMANGCKNIRIAGRGRIDGNSPELVKRFEAIQSRQTFLDFFPQIKKGELVSYIGPTGNPTTVDPYALEESGKLGTQIYGTHTRPTEAVRPQIIEFRKCVGVTIEDVTLADSANWVQTYRDCEDMLFRRVKVRSTKYWNNDGLDLVDCRRVKILDCDFDSADDALCLKSEPFGAGCSDIVAARLKLASRASAIKFGTASHVGFKRIRISDVTVRDTYRSAVAIQSVDGAEIEDITVERVKATNTGNAFFIRLGHRNRNRAPGSIRGIHLRDFDVQVPELPKDYYREIGQAHNLIPASIVGMPGHLVQDVVIENVRVSYGGNSDRNHAYVPLDKIGDIPENEGAYPEFSMWGELPAWALYVRHAQSITFRKAYFRLAKPDFRPAIVSDDTDGLTLLGLRVSGKGGLPHCFFRNTPRHLIQGASCEGGADFKVETSN